MNKNIGWFLALFALIVICIIVYGVNETLTINIYMFNTYMYILLGIIIVAATWFFTDEYTDEKFFGMTGWHLISLFVITFVALIVVTAAHNPIITHIAWLLFMICVGLLSYISYKQSQLNDTLLIIFLSLITLVGILSWFAYTQPLNAFDSWFNPMIAILIGLIIVQLIDYFFFYNKNKGGFMTRFRIYSWIALVLFSGFLLYDTQNLRKNAIIATQYCPLQKQSQCINYPSASLNIFIDILNLFTSISNVSH